MLGNDPSGYKACALLAYCLKYTLLKYRAVYR